MDVWDSAASVFPLETGVGRRQKTGKAGARQRTRPRRWQERGRSRWRRSDGTSMGGAHSRRSLPPCANGEGTGRIPTTSRTGADPAHARHLGDGDALRRAGLAAQLRRERAQRLRHLQVAPPLNSRTDRNLTIPKGPTRLVPSRDPTLKQTSRTSSANRSPPVPLYTKL